MTMLEFPVASPPGGVQYLDMEQVASIGPLYPGDEWVCREPHRTISLRGGYYVVIPDGLALRDLIARVTAAPYVPALP